MLQRAFVIGLRCKDPVWRAKFVDIFHSHVHQTVAQRLKYILASQDWQPFSDAFWLTQALDLLLAIVKDGVFHKRPQAARAVVSAAA